MTAVCKSRPVLSAIILVFKSDISFSTAIFLYHYFRHMLRDSRYCPRIFQIENNALSLLLYSLCLLFFVTLTVFSPVKFFFKILHHSKLAHRHLHFTSLLCCILAGYTFTIGVLILLLRVLFMIIYWTAAGFAVAASKHFTT